MTLVNLTKTNWIDRGLGTYSFNLLQQINLTNSKFRA